MQSVDFLSVFLLILAGAFSGFTAGMLGIGGGIVIVSALVYIFSARFAGVEYLQHTAVGSSFAIMVFTGLVNVWAQSRSRNVDWQTCKKFAPSLIFGVILGSIFSLGIPEKILRLLFVCFLYFSAIRMFVSEPAPKQVARPVYYLAGTGIGAFSSWVGIGGGALMVPFFRFCGLSAHNAIGSSGVLTFPVALAGAISYLSTGSYVNNPIPHTLGFIYLPALIIMSICTIIFVPLGAKCKTKLSARTLKILFAIMIVSIAILMSCKLLSDF